MKKEVFVLWVLSSFMACNKRQNVDNQMFDLSKYRSVLGLNKVYDAYSSIRIQTTLKDLDSLSKLKILDSVALVQIFQDSSDYYKKNIPSSGSFVFNFDSIIFETADYCGITINRIGYSCWTTYYKTFFLVYKKGKLVGIEEVAGVAESWGGTNTAKTQSKVINNNSFLVETVKLRRKNEDDYENQYSNIDTLTKLVTFGLNGKLETTTIFEETKPFRKYHVLKVRNPLTGHLEIRKLYFYKDKND